MVSSRVGPFLRDLFLGLRFYPRLGVIMDACLAVEAVSLVSAKNSVGYRPLLEYEIVSTAFLSMCSYHAGF